MKKLALLSLSLFALCACGAQMSEADYFDALEKAGNAYASHDALGVDGSNISLSFSLANKDGKDLTVETTPLSFSARFAGAESISLKDIGMSFTMPRSTSSLNRVTLKGSMLEGSKIISTAAAVGLALSTNLYLDSEFVYLDLSDAATLRTVIYNILKEADIGLDRLPAKSKFAIGLDEMDFLEDYLPLTQYGEDVVNSFVDSLKTSYEASKDAFSFTQKDGTMVISFATSNKDDVKAIFNASSLAGTGMFDIDKVLNYAKTVSYSADIKFNETSILDTSFSLKASDFDKEAILADNPDLSYYPTGTFRLGGKFSFVSGEAASLASKGNPEDYTLLELDTSAIAGGVLDSI